MRKNIWIINHYATEMYRAGGGRHHWFAKELLKEGYNPIIICSNVYYTTSNQDIDVGPTGFKQFEADGVKYIMIKTSTYTSNDVHRVKNILDFYINVRRFAKDICKINKPDVVIGSSVHPLTCVAAIKIAKKFSIPCISEIRDLWPEELIRDDGLSEKSLLARGLFGIEHWIYKNSDAIIFTMQGAMQYIKDRKWDLENGGDVDINKAHYINNGVNLEEFDNNLSTVRLDDHDLEENSFKVIYTGAIRKTNGVERLLEIGKRLADIPDLKILLWGDGDQAESISRRIQTEGISNVIYKGRVGKQYIPYILSKSTINILNYVSGNSFYYGCSNNKLFEYLAAGKPILCTVKMNYSILKQYQCGIEVETNEEIEHEIRRIYDGGEELQSMLAKNTRKAAENFDFKEHTRRLIEIIECI